MEVIDDMQESDYEKEDKEEVQANDEDQDEPSILHMDYRIRWVRDRVMKFFGLTGQEHLFDNLINANNRYFEDKLFNFLILDLYGVTDLEKKLIFFYKTYVNEIFQEEVSVWEESQRAKITALTAFTSKSRTHRLTKSAPGKVEKPDDDGKKRKKIAKKGKKSKSGKADISEADIRAASRTAMSTSTMHTPSIQESSEEDIEEDDDREKNGSGDFSTYSKKKGESKSAPTDSSNFAPPPGEEDKYILIKKMVEKVRKIPVLHMIYGQIDSNRIELQDVTFFYFMRTSDEGIPSFDTYEECLEEITDYVVVGSLDSKFLVSMNRILVDIFKPLVESQFRGPDFFERWRMRKVDDDIKAPIEKATAALASIESRSSKLRRPSEFRRASVLISRQDLNVRRNNDNDGLISASSLQNENVRSRKLRSNLRGSQRSSTADSRSSKSSLREVRRHQPMVQQSKKDILDYLDNLIETVEWALEHIEGDILLTMPKIPELSDITITDDILLKNKNIVEQMEEVVMSWEKHIQKVLDSYVKMLPGKGPIAEYQHWQNCETGLTMLVEQLKMPIVKRILGLLEKAMSTIADGFQYFQMELWKHYIEARDNNKFIQTLLRHFKLITESDSFESITECLPSLMEGLRMLWVLSSYYSSEEKMMLLLDKISWQLCENVKKNLAIVLLFKMPLEVILQKTSGASAMLRQWKRSYLKTRQDIELSGKGVRWEFNQKRLFQSTEYIAEVCSDLYKIAGVLQDFYNIFGSDLKFIIDDPAQIDAVVKRVDALVVPIEEADFDIFNVFNKENWEAITTCFYEEVSFLEDQAKFYIDECFTVLINAEKALEILLKFKNTKTRLAIQQQLLRKFDVIMQQFSKEISIVENIYYRGRRHPPLLTYHPPMAGAIFWIRKLFHRLRRPVLIFQEVRELKHSEVKLLAFSQYFDIAKQMKEFEEITFNTWLDKAVLTITSTTKKSILKMVRIERETPTMLIFPDEQRVTKNLQLIHLASKTKDRDADSVLSTPRGSLLKHDAVISKPSSETTSSAAVGSRVSLSMQLGTKDNAKGSLQKEYKGSTISSDKQDARAKITWTEFINSAILVECQLCFQLNFDWEVFEVIREAELMEQLGFELPTILRDIGIQKNRLRADIDVTEKMINQYNDIIDTLDKADVQLLKQTLQDVERHIQPGVTRLNWNSLNISDYASTCGKMLKNLNSIVEQVKQMKRDLDIRIESELQSYHLFSTKKESAESEVLLSCKTYFLEITNRRTELVSSMSKAYQSISPMLMKLESLVLGTSTGKSPAMQLLYEKYEKKIFGAFIICMVSNMEVLNKMLNGTKPIFQVDAILIASEVVLRPSPSEIYNIICHDIRDLLERLKGFSRWMNGTCLECKPQKKEFSEDLISFSFFEDVMSVRIINELVRTVQNTAYKLSVECWRYLYRWKKYSNLWSFDKNLVCEKFATTKPTLLQYDEKFTFYGGILEELEDMMSYFDVNSVRINLKPLLSGIERHAKEWKQILGNYLLSDTVQAMNDLKMQIETLRGEVELVITGLERFILIMQAIADVRKMAVQAEVQFLSYQECFRTMRAHLITFSPSDEVMAYELQRDWESLYLGAFYRASTLESTSDRFCEMTEDQIQQFLNEIIKFAKDFEAHGPGSIEDNLEFGLKKMEEYGKLIDKYEERRLNLTKSEILFDLPATDYSVFLKIKKEYKDMEILYNLYKQQKSAREIWAKTLWVNLNPQQLIEGMEHFMREFRRLPKSVRAMNVGHALDANMKHFKNSVPLFIELKNEAMRERHWQELMRRTGQYFDMDPDRCGND